MLSTSSSLLEHASRKTSLNYCLTASASSLFSFSHWQQSRKYVSQASWKCHSHVNQIWSFSGKFCPRGGGAAAAKGITTAMKGTPGDQLIMHCQGFRSMRRPYASMSSRGVSAARSSSVLPHDRQLTEDDLKQISRDILRTQDPPRNYSKVRQASAAIAKKPTMDLLVSRGKAFSNLRMYQRAAKDYEEASKLAHSIKQLQKEKEYRDEAQFMGNAKTRDENPGVWFQDSLVFDDILYDSLMNDKNWNDTTWRWESDLPHGKVVKYVSQNDATTKGSTYNAKHWKKTLKEAKSVDENSRVDRPLTHIPWYFDVLRTLSFVRPELLTAGLNSSIAGAQYGIYSVQFFDKNKWHTVVIDDEIPLLENMPRLTRSEDEYDLWPLLVEKAYAKFLGSYRAISQLQEKNEAYMMEALVHLTGGSFVRYMHDSHVVDLMFTYMQGFEKEHAIMMAYTPEHWIHSHGDYQNGLKRGNVPYIVSKVYSLRLSDGEQKKFVRLRNPHFYDGVPKVWTGNFNYDDTKWTPFLKKELEHGTLLETEFVMEYEAFLTHFAFTDMLHTNEAGRDWVTKNCGEIKVNPKVPAQIQITADKKKAHVFVCLTQQSDEVYPVRMQMFESHKKNIAPGQYVMHEELSDYDIITEDIMWRQNRHTAIGTILKVSTLPRTVNILIDSPKPVSCNVVVKTNNKGLRVQPIQDRGLSILERIEMDWYLMMFGLAALSFFAYISWGVRNLSKIREKEAADLRRLKAAAQGLITEDVNSVAKSE